MISRLHVAFYRLRRRWFKSSKRIYREFLIFIGLRIGKLVDISEENAETLGLVKAIEVAPPVEVALTDPYLCEFLHSQTAVPFENCTFSRRAIKAYILKDVQLHVPSGTVCTRDNAIIMDSERERKRMKDSPVYGGVYPKPTPIKGVYSSIWGVWSNNYFHWLIEYILKLYSLSIATNEPIQLLMPITMSEMQKMVLDYCLPDNMTIRYMHDTDWLQIETFVYAPYPVVDHDFGCLPKPHLDFLRTRVFERLQLTDEHKCSENIYISRNRCKVRRVLNEPEVIACLVPYGFETYILEDLTFEDQVRLFHQANIVVAPHGAGLTNIVFSGSIRLIELFGSHPIPLYFFLSQVLGQQYYYLFAKENKSFDPSLKPPDARYYQARDEDFKVNIEELTRLIDSLLVSSKKRADLGVDA